MTVPSIEITEQGVIAPPTSEVVSGFWDIFINAFGGDLNTAMNTPQGQLVTSLSAMTQDERNQIIKLMSMIDPRYSTGVYQDAIAYIYFLTRKKAIPSIASIEFTGLSSSAIPKGFLLVDENNNQWKTSNAYTIGISGTVTGFVESVAIGEISASPNTINRIVVALSGLDRVNNPSAAIIGTNEESPQDFELRRSESVSANSTLVDSAVRGAIADMPDVLDVWVQSNNSSTATTFGKTNYPVERNSILVSVVGGDDYEVAWNILVKAGTGCGFNGNTTITVYDNDSYPVTPPSYEIKFLRPTLTNVHFKLTIEDISKMSYQNELTIKSTLLNALKTGVTKARIAQVLRAVQYVAPIANAVNLSIISLEVSLDGSVWLDFLEFGVDQFPTSDESLITVVGL